MKAPSPSRPRLACALGLLAFGLLAGCGSGDTPSSVEGAQQILAAPESEEQAQAAWDFLQAEADNGDADAMYALAEHYGQGRVVARNPEQVAQWLGRAAQAGHAGAQTDLALLVIARVDSGEVSRDQISRATSLLEQAAAQDEPRALDQLGTLHVAAARSEFELDQAVASFQRAVELGYGPSMLRLATLYFTGKGVEQDTARGIALLKRAADAGQNEAAFRLADLYQVGGPVERDLGQARLYLEKAATTGGAEADYRLASFYLRHHAPDPALAQEAVRLLRKRATNNHADSQQLLGRCYLTGNGVAVDPAAAAQWFRLAANNGNAQAMTSLAVLLQAGVGQPAEGEVDAWLAQAAEGGDPRADFILYQQAKQATPAGDPPSEEALRHLNTAVEARLPQALYEMGRRLVEGDGMDEDGAEGYRLLEQAGRQGHVAALRLMGEMFRDGGTLRQDPEKARALLELAARNGDAEAARQLGLLLEESGDPDQLAAARESYRQAAARGDAAAQSQLGRMLLTGEGGPADPAGAIDLLTAAYEQGDPQASLVLGKINESGLPGRGPDIAQAAQLYREAAQAGLQEAGFRLVRLIDAHGADAGRPDEAVALLRELASDDYPGARPLLGQWQLEGRHLRKDLLAALRTFRAGAEDGDAECLYQLGVIYEAGRGVEADPIRAAGYYRQAAEQSHPGALNNLGVMHLHGYGVGQNRQKARELLRQAQAAGHPQAAENLLQIP
ncbi:MAG: tetratricopeptide repeat protein [Verrucomicrobiota bacterium]